MSRQITSTILMIRPVSFKLNPQTAVNNYYQKVVEGLSSDQAQKQALMEFDNFVSKLRIAGINVIVVSDSADPETPDSIFPNNWISFHHDGTIALYPMYAENRRLERRDDISDILEDNGFVVERIKDFSYFERDNLFLEGTGSMLLDRDNHLVYAAISDRTDLIVLNKFCEEFSYKPITFQANQTVDGDRLPIYHTNVMMCLTDKISVICLASIDNQAERKRLVTTLRSTEKEIIDLSESQINHFAGNMLAVANSNGERFMIMSEAAQSSLKPEQKEIIELHYTIISSSLDTIEALGGGSARCMMAEVFLPRIDLQRKQTRYV